MQAVETTGAKGAGRLSIVATPIGNLEDLTFRALRTLKEADLIVAEDTRRTSKLCRHYGIETRLRPLHAHSNAHAVERCVQELLRGEHLALVSDAGTPLISDPGLALVQAASDHAIAVETIPGPSAVMAALTAATIAFEEFSFIGFLPRSGSSRRRAIENVVQETHAVVLFESPKRVSRTLAQLAERLDPSRPVAVCRELTKIHEEVVRASAAELAERFRDGTLGEVTIVIGGRDNTEKGPSKDDIDRLIISYLDQGMTARDITRAIGSHKTLSRHDLYTRVIALANARQS
jgi:16S rRNA (cytidine1402-2'-O)-methyltransferase